MPRDWWFGTEELNWYWPKKFVEFYSAHSSGILNDHRRSMEITLTNTVEHEKKEVVAMLLSAGVDPNCKNEEGIPAIHLAIQSQVFTQILPLLIDSNADPSATASNERGEPAIHLAACLGHLRATKLLYVADADIDGVNAHGRSVFFSAFDAESKINPLKVMRYLIIHVEDIDLPDKNGQHLLHELCRRGYKDILSKLLLYATDLDPIDENGKTLYYAEEGHHKDIVEILKKQMGEVFSVAVPT